jgi:hypothetical protein
MMSERRAAGVCGAVIERARWARRGAIEFQREHERGAAYLLTWMLGLPLGIIPALAPGIGR